ncbi:MAG: alpha-2-macroglobulin, partial [Comamonadaceae bacterium]
KDPLRYATLTCNRKLPAAGKVQLVFGKGVSTPSGVANTIEKSFGYEVREPFSASFSCERENAQAACLPVRPMTLSFNAPVERKLAGQIRLTTGSESLKPAFEKAEGDDEDVVNGISFKQIFAERAQFTLELPAGFQDASGRSLRNAESFPLKVATGAMPPLAKFAAAPFGIVERHAEPGSVPLLPVTLRNVEAALRTSAVTPGKVSDLQPRADAEIIAWQRKLQRYDEWQVPRKQAQADVKGPLPKALEAEGREWVQARMVSLLAGQAGVKTLDLPKPASSDPRPFEVVGIPLTPGFHVVEIASPMLGESLLDARYGAPRTMYVRTSALVTNIGVHFKLGRENAMAWVTSLDKGKPVPNAAIRVSDCSGKEVATGTTDAQGIAWLKGLAPQAPRCPGEDEYREAYFVSARTGASGTGAAASGAGDDLAFTWSDSNRGIEPWRFNVPTSREARPDERMHTIFARTLLRAKMV